MKKGTLFCHSSQYSCAICCQQFDYYQLFFFSHDLADFCDLVASLPRNGRSLHADIIGDQAACIEAVEACGFRYYDSFYRLSRVNRTVKSFAAPKEWLATPQDAAEIEDMLLRQFDTHCDQIPDLYDLQHLIAAGHIFVIRDEEKSCIASAILFETYGKMIVWKHWLTRPAYRRERRGLLLYLFFQRYMENFQRQILFVHKNSTSQNFYQTFHFQRDGLSDHVYVLP
ncbi:MAG: hypothetical protein ACTTJE_03630 [Schwartzia sp. (in: firmicutes)]